MKRPADVDTEPPRLLPSRQLPPYSYVSGKFPHPTRDPTGHSYGAAEPPVIIDHEARWRECDAYLWGLDLFNNGYYWEAHETWEAVWHAAGRRGPLADFAKSLIKLAAAGVKAREGRANGVRRHAERAKELLKSLESVTGRGQQYFMGLSIPALQQYAQQLVHDPVALLNTSDEAVVRVIQFALLPK